MDIHVLQARTVPPVVARSVTGRPRLFSLLDDAVHFPVTAIIGPAGYGKTTLISTWAANQSLQVAWLSIDADLNEPSLFTHHLTASLLRVQPDFRTDVSDLIRLAADWDSVKIGARLVDDLLDLYEDVILVLDDYHAISNSAIHELMAAIIRHPPPRLHLVISSRVDPPLPLARARAQGLLNEIRSAQLRFTESETETFFRNDNHSERSTESVHILYEQTEGWPAGLRLVQLAARQRDGQAALIPAGVEVGFKQIDAFLFDEVLSQQDENTIDFLLRTSITPRISASLADALADEPPVPGASQQMLDSLVQADLFVSALGTDGTWYRYHYLLQQALQNRLNAGWTPEKIARLHRSASAWLETNGDIDDAVNHAIEAGDPGLAAEIIERQALAVFAREDRRPVERWLSHLPPGAIEDRPALQLVRGTCAQLRGASQEASAALARFDRIVGPAREQESDDLQALRMVREVIELSISGTERPPEDIAALARRALYDLPQDRRYLRSEAVTWLGAAMAYMGDRDDGIKELEAIARREADRVDIVLLSTLRMIVYLQTLTGYGDRAESNATRLLKFATRVRHIPSLGWAHLELGIINYERGNRGKAVEHFAAVIAHRDAAHPFALREADLGLARVHVLEGRISAARNTVNDLVARLEEAEAQSLLPPVRAFSALLDLLEGKTDQVEQWLARGWRLEGQWGTSRFANIQVIAARALLGVGRAAEAVDVAEELLAAKKEARNVPAEIVGRAVKAAALDAMGERAKAFMEIRAAISLAGRANTFQGLLDAGPEVQQLLHRIAATEGVNPRLGELLHTSIPEPSSVPVPEIPKPRTTSMEVPMSGTVAERLTDREIEVLERLGQRMSNKEIADELFISPLTVKRHSINLYGKLNVASRRQAVLQARALGLLPQE